MTHREWEEIIFQQSLRYEDRILEIWEWEIGNTQFDTDTRSNLSLICDESVES